MTNGSVNPDAASATAGTTITLTVTPNTGYALKAGTLKYRYGGSDYTPSGSGLTYTFAMPAADVTVSAEFEALPPDTYSVTPASMTGGAVNPNAASATAGTTITLTVTPNAGYTLKTGTLKYSHGGSDYPLTGGPPYTFAMPAANVTVSAEFKLDNNAALTIEVFRDEAASVRPEHSAGHTPPTDISWGSGESVIFTLDSSDYTAEAGTLKWFVNGTEKTATGNSLTIKARDYVKRSYTLTVMIKYGGQWYSADAGFRVTE
jgi:hypothetical protein